MSAELKLDERSRCAECGKPEATREDYRVPDAGELLCWSRVFDELCAEAEKNDG